MFPLSAGGESVFIHKMTPSTVKGASDVATVTDDPHLQSNLIEWSGTEVIQEHGASVW